MQFAAAANEGIGAHRAEVGLLPWRSPKYQVAGWWHRYEWLCVAWIVLRQEAKLHLFLHIQGLERLRIGHLAQIVVGEHRCPSGGKRFVHRTAREQGGVETDGEDTGGAVKHRIGGIDRNDILDAGGDQGLGQTGRMAGAEEGQPARLIADQTAKLVRVEIAQHASLILQRQHTRTVEVAATVSAEMQDIERLAGGSEEMSQPMGGGDGGLNLNRHPQVTAGLFQTLNLLLHR